jgi:hypothetical protein
MAAEQLGESALIVLRNKLLQELLVGPLAHAGFADELAELAKNGLGGALAHDPA